LNFIFYFEKNEVILNKFVESYVKIRDEFEKKHEINTSYALCIIEIGFNIHNYSDIDTEKLKALGEQVKNYAGDMSGYTSDLMKALQNYYQSELFGGYKIPKRQPQDKSVKVLTTPD